MPAVTAGLTEVLTREPSRHHIDPSQRFDFPNVTRERNAWKALFQHAMRAGIDFAEEF